MRTHRLLGVFLIASSVSGCIGFEHKGSTIAPSSSTESLVGIWSAAAVTNFPTPSSCGGFTWRITSQEGARVTGEASATCAGGVGLSGTATGTVGGTTIPFEARGTATGLPINPCSFTLNGTGEIGADRMNIAYTGSTCLGAISGNETIRRR